MGNRINFWVDVWGGWEEVFGDSHQGGHQWTSSIQTIRTLFFRIYLGYVNRKREKITKQSLHQTSCTLWVNIQGFSGRNDERHLLILLSAYTIRIKKPHEDMQIKPLLRTRISSFTLPFTNWSLSLSKFQFQRARKITSNLADMILV